MGHMNVEIKAYCSDADRVRRILRAEEADFRGTDHQVDTYFRVPHGRLKLRRGQIENALIYYERSNQQAPKPSRVHLCPIAADCALDAVLAAALPVRVVVEKDREIYFIGNVKFHIDVVPQLGHFVEIEAIDTDGRHDEGQLRQQCRDYMQRFGIGPDDLVGESYADLLQLAGAENR